MDICLLSLLCLVMGRFRAEPIIRPGGSTDCGASFSVIYKPQEWGGNGSHWTAALLEKNLNM